jgi:hypothetical protein
MCDLNATGLVSDKIKHMVRDDRVMWGRSYCLRESFIPKKPYSKDMKTDHVRQHDWKGYI